MLSDCSLYVTSSLLERKDTCDLVLWQLCHRAYLEIFLPWWLAPGTLRSFARHYLAGQASWALSWLWAKVGFLPASHRSSCREGRVLKDDRSSRETCIQLSSYWPRWDYRDCQRLQPVNIHQRWKCKCLAISNLAMSAPQATCNSIVLQAFGSCCDQGKAFGDLLSSPCFLSWWCSCHKCKVESAWWN